MPARHHLRLPDGSDGAAQGGPVRTPRAERDLPKTLADIGRHLDHVDERIDARLFQLEQRLELRTRQTMQQLQDGFAGLAAVERRMTWLMVWILATAGITVWAGLR